METALRSLIILIGFGGNLSAHDPRQCPQDLVNQISVAKTQEEKATFHEQYLAKYFPRALVIRGRFLAKMKPSDIDQALDDIVNIFKVEPGFYFANESELVKIWLYLEVVVGQLSIMSEFLKKAYIDRKNEEVFLTEPLLFGVGSSHLNCTFLRTRSATKGLGISPRDQLIPYLREMRFTGIDRFYATYFDYLKKLFNQAILFQDQRLAQKYQHELEFVMTKLRGTSFERLYQDPLNVGKELLSILQSRVTQDHDEDDDLDDDSKGMDDE
ncbi:hypothetical protein FJ364_03175 [Candidatus Dependentiae bacterium]|nr:hypothetical protein [Candidatus Dependentiae bacterium]